MISILQTATSAVRTELAFNSLCREMAKDNISLACNYIKSAVTGVSTHFIHGSTTSVSFKNRCINLIKAPLLLLRAPLLYLPLTNRVTQLTLCFLFPQKPTDFVEASLFHPTESELKVRYDENTLAAFTNARLKAAEQLLEKNIRKKQGFDPLTFNSKNLLNAYISLSPPLSIVLINSPEFKQDEAKARYSEDMRCKFVEKFIQEKLQQKITNQLQISKNDFIPSNEEKLAIAKLGFTDKSYSNICLRFLAKKKDSLNMICSSDLQKKINHYQKKYFLN